jgi:macrodomain Ter protein organizer (MatP/YcbG family)
MFEPFENHNCPRWQVFSSHHWDNGHLYGEYKKLSDADDAMQQLRERGFAPKLVETWSAHYSHSTNH